MSFERELRSASDSLLRALEQVHELEMEKRAELPGTPKFVELARRIEDLALEVLRRTEHQEVLARESATLRHAGQGIDRPIEAIEPPRHLATVLDEWRAAERRLMDAGPGSDEAHEAAAASRRLRDEYRRAHAERAREPG